MRYVVLGLSIALAQPALAQEQQAGNEASTNAEQTFQELIAKCDDAAALQKRARIRLLLGRTTEAAAAEAQQKLDEGLAKCGEGELQAALTLLDDALQVANAGTEVTLGSATEQAGEKVESAPVDASAVQTADETAPWWQFWK